MILKKISVLNDDNDLRVDCMEVIGGHHEKFTNKTDNFELIIDSGERHRREDSS